MKEIASLASGEDLDPAVGVGDHIGPLVKVPRTERVPSGPWARGLEVLTLVDTLAEFVIKLGL
jgi:hypothetical protein